MKTKQKERLYSDFVKYCDQIGIPCIERPMLTFDSKEYNIVRKLYGAGVRRHSTLAGECYCLAKTIYIDTKKKVATRKTYPSKLKRKRLGIVYSYRNVKPTYRDFLYVLVHELVHYRFRSMRHGERFENLIKEILKGRTFPIETC